MVKLSPKGHVVAKMATNNYYQLKQDIVESGPSTAADTTVSTLIMFVHCPVLLILLLGVWY